MDYRLHSGTEALDEVREAWEWLEARSPGQVFKTYALARLWLDTLGKESHASPRIVTAYENGTVVGLFPAAIVRHGAVRLLTWLGGPQALDCGDVLFDPQSTASADEFVRESLAILRSRDRSAFLYLPNVRDDAFAYNGLTASARPYKRSVSPYITLEGDLTAYMHGLGRKKRHDVERLVRRLEAAGSVEFALLCHGDPEVEDAVSELMALQRRRYESRGPLAMSWDEGYEKYLTQMALHDAHTTVARLRLDGATIAASLQCIFNGRMHGIVTTYDDDYRTYSPGSVLLYRLVGECYDRHLDVCDLGWGDDPYKRQWTDKRTGLTTFVGRSVRGWFLRNATNARRKVIGSLQRAKRAADS